MNVDKVDKSKIEHNFCAICLVYNNMMNYVDGFCEHFVTEL